MMWIWIPIVFAILRMATGKYVFSALTTLSCAALVIRTSPLAGAALIVSALGDWFMAHKGSREDLYIMGIVGFFAAHILWVIYGLRRVETLTIPLAVGALMSAFYAWYLTQRALPKIPKGLKLPVALYSVISLVAYTCAMTTGNIWYALGICLLLFSDTMIAEHDFVGNQAAGILILPTYYLCQILVAVSILL